MSVYKLLIDECLTPKLVNHAIRAGHVESTCVKHRGLLGSSDKTLVAFAVEHDLTLVTHNASDFRGSKPESAGGLYANLVVHAGLICLSSPFAMNHNRQIDLFDIALRELSRYPNLINTVLEVLEHTDDSIDVKVYGLPH